MKTPDYHEIIKWDITNFVTLHDRPASGVYYGRLKPTLAQDLTFLTRVIIGGIVHIGCGIIKSLASHLNISRGIRVRSPYLILVTIGTTKYASEENQFVTACAKKGLSILTIYPSLGIKVNPSDDALQDFSSLFRVSDYLYVVANWFLHLIMGFKYLLAGDQKKRSLFVLSVPSIKRHFIDLVVIRRIISIHGRPLALMSLCPAATTSVVIVNYLRRLAIPTGGMRTQTTNEELEHQVINVDTLFCKSVNEFIVYKNTLGCAATSLEKGCVLSLPEISSIEPLQLPNQYVLLLGTAPGAEQSMDDYSRYNSRIFRIGEQTGLPIVFKGHNLAQFNDEKWFSCHPEYRDRCLRVFDMRHNRELIKGATIIISTVSTLLYYAILCEKPIILVETSLVQSSSTEFNGPGFIWHGWSDSVENFCINLTDLTESSRTLKSWIEDQYFLEYGADHIINHVLSKANVLYAESLN